MALTIVSQKQFKWSFGNYWGIINNQLSHKSPILSVVEMTIGAELVIDRVSAIVFENESGWWIGALYLSERDKFKCLGPYNTANDAYVYLKLICN